MKKLFIVIVLLSVLGGTCHPDYKIELGDGYYLDTYERNYPAICDSNRIAMITATIVDYSYDSVFIVVKQKPYEIIWRLYREIPNLGYKEAHRLYRESKEYYYWIINKKQENIWHYDTVTQKGYHENIYGPFELEEYLQKRDELGVSDSLRLLKYD